MLRHLVNLLLAALPPSRWFALRAFLLRRCGVDAQRDTSVCGRGWIYGRGELHIGHGTWLSPQVVFYTHPQAPIRIGDDCDIGPGAEFITGSHEIGPAQRRAGTGRAAPITVGRGTWIGAGVRVLGGVEIGEGCVVAAGAVVTESLPPHSLAAGVPATARKALP